MSGPAITTRPRATRAARGRPLDEAAHRRLILAYARTGRTSDALRQYLEYRKALVTEVGVEPSAETSRLRARILAGGSVGTGPPAISRSGVVRAAARLPFRVRRGGSDRSHPSRT